MCVSAVMVAGGLPPRWLWPRLLHCWGAGASYVLSASSAYPASTNPSVALPVVQSFKDSSSGAVSSSSKVRLLESDPSVTPTPWDLLCHVCTKSLNLSILWFIHLEIRGHKAVPLYFPGGATCRYGGGRLRRQGVL